MNKHLIYLAFAAIVALAGAVSAGTYSGGGYGTAEQPYRISTAADMQSIGANPGDWEKHFVLTADIDLAAYTGTQFNIIGTFTGVFDGNGHTISNFSCTVAEANGIRLSAYLGEEGEIRNMRVENVMLAVGRGYSIGGLVGTSNNGEISG